MTMKLLVLGAGGYIGRNLIPVLAQHADFSVTAVTSQPIAPGSPGVATVCTSLEDLPFRLAGDHDLVLNLASAGVAHKDEDDLRVLSDNLAIAHHVCRFAECTRRRLLVHFGSDTEQSSLSAYLPSAEGMSLPASLVQQPTSLYSLSKTMQSTLIRYFTAKSQFRAHVVMTPNVYGGLDQPYSLMGAMRSAIVAGQPFTVQTPAIVKRFVHISAFSSYVVGVLQDLSSRFDHSEATPRFAVSSMDFVPRTTVGAFARHQWLLLGGAASELRGFQAD